MRAKTSPLRILSFEILECVFKTIAPDEIEDIDHQAYLLDVSFDILEGRNDELEAHLLPIKFKINVSKNPKPGYFIEVKAIGSFSIDNESTLEEQVVQNLKVFSSVNIMISNIRGFLRDITSYGPFGTYQLPSIDMSELLLEKQRSLKQKRKRVSKK